MEFVYNISVRFIYFLLRIIALFNNKIKLFIEGRKTSFKLLNSLTNQDKVLWFHAASLGEFEQGRPIIEALKQTYSSYKIVVTFFSPSGYEVRKNYAHADIICYLPFDTQKNMQRFFQIVHPEIAIIIKYEFWPNLLNQLQKHKITTILVAGIFRKNQSFFKWYGTFMRKKLNAFNFFFVQNESSKKMLNSINFNNVVVGGDTRFDRVYDILHQDNKLNFIAEFKDNKFMFVAGSTWPEDEALIVHYINTYAKENEKFILAPHTISPNKIKELQLSISKKTVLFSEQNKVSLKECQVLIINTIGILTKIYSYADFAYIGGGLATGLHNILEPAIYGIPVVFGAKKYKKFQEAHDLLNLKGAFIVANKKEFCYTFTKLKTNQSLRLRMGQTNLKYIKNNIGATQRVLKYIKEKL